jgi:hypothetical protein
MPILKICQLKKNTPPGTAFSGHFFIVREHPFIMLDAGAGITGTNPGHG